MRGNHFVFNSRMEQINHILWVLALKHIKVFNHKLFFFCPPYTETLLVTCRTTFPTLVEEGVWIEEIVDSFVVNLQEGTKYRNVFSFLFFAPFHFSKKVLNCSLGYT